MIRNSAQVNSKRNQNGNRNKKKQTRTKRTSKSFLDENCNNINISITNNNESSKAYSNKSFSEVEQHLKSVEDFKDFIKVKNPKFVEEFNLEEILNKGSYGVILKGKSRKFKRNFAFKFIFNKRIIQQKREHCLKRIRNEIGIQYKLKNKNINQFYGFYEIADTFCYVLEHEKYGDLSNFMKILKRPIISESLIGFIAVQILNALKFCHDCKIAHLDIKKQNILVDENLNFKLCDFSVSTEYMGNDVRLNRVGSSLYISPENLNRNLIKNSDISKIDTYSLGVLLYNLAFKAYPYNLNIEDSQNFETIVNKIKDEDLKIPVNHNHSAAFRNFLRLLLEKDIEKRLNICSALSHPWILAANKLTEEKEKIQDNEKFLIMLVTDNIKGFNDAKESIKVSNQ